MPGFGPVEACKWYAFLQYEDGFRGAALPTHVDQWYPKFEVPKGTGGGKHPKEVESN